MSKVPPKALQGLKPVLELLDLVNAVPPSGLPDLGWPESGIPLSVDTITEAWAARAAQLDPKGREFIGPVTMMVTERWIMLHEAVRAIRKFALVEPEDRKPGMTLATPRVSLSIDVNGKIVQIPNSLLQRLDGLDADRIRLCDCGHVFWAKRKDQPCCGKTCANARRVKNWREKYPDYKSQRYRSAEKSAEHPQAKHPR